MRKEAIRTIVWAGLVCFLLHLVPASGWARAKSSRVMINFDGTSLVRVIKWMSRHTGRNFVLEDALREHTITIITGSPVSLEEAHRAFLTALEAEGLHVIEEGGFCTVTRHPRQPRRQPVERMSMGDCPPPEGIDAIDATTWRIDREQFVKWMNDTQCLPKQVRIVPHFEDGKPRGFKLFAIRSNTLFDQLGFRNGDVIRAIDGQEIATPDKALQAYQKLKEAHSFQVDILRRGEPRTHTYRVE